MALPQGFLEEKDKEKLSIPPKASLQTILNGLPYHAAIIVSVCNTNYNKLLGDEKKSGSATWL